MIRVVLLLLLAMPLYASPRRMATRTVPDSGPYLTYRVPMGLVDALWAADDGSIWFGSRLGVGRLVPGVGSEIRDRGPCTPFAVTTDETIWCAGAAIRRIHPSGQIDTYPESASYLAAAADGTLFFTQPESNRIGRITADGVVTVFDLPPSLVRPTKIIVDSAGDVWFLAHRVLVKIVSDGMYHEIRADELFERRTLQTSFWSLIVASDGTLWLTIPPESKKSSFPTTGGAMVRLTAEGTLVVDRTRPVFEAPFDPTIAPDGSFWYYMTGLHWFLQHVVRVHDGKGTFYDTPEESPDLLDQTTALTVDRAGNVWIAVQRGGRSVIAMLIPAP